MKEKEKMAFKPYAVVNSSEWMTWGDHGWGNGYVVLPKGHKYWGKDYNDIPVQVHYGLTFASPAKDLNWIPETDTNSDAWVIGFDTNHLNDNLADWPKERVEQETNNLLKQMI